MLMVHNAQEITTSESVRVCLCVYMCIYVYTYKCIFISVYYIYGHIYVYVYYIYMHILFFGSGGRAASCMMARSRVTYVLSHFSRLVSYSCTGSVLSVQVDHVVTVLKSCVMSFLSIVSSATPAPHITGFPT